MNGSAILGTGFAFGGLLGTTGTGLVAAGTEAVSTFTFFLTETVLFVLPAAFSTSQILFRISASLGAATGLLSLAEEEDDEDEEKLALAAATSFVGFGLLSIHFSRSIRRSKSCELQITLSQSTAADDTDIGFKGFGFY